MSSFQWKRNLPTLLHLISVTDDYIILATSENWKLWGTGNIYRKPSDFVCDKSKRQNNNSATEAYHWENILPDWDLCMPHSGAIPCFRIITPLSYRTSGNVFFLSNCTLFIPLSLLFVRSFRGFFLLFCLPCELRHVSILQNQKHKLYKKKWRRFSSHKQMFLFHLQYIFRSRCQVISEKYKSDNRIL
jgi:hypothetical protein